MEEDRLRELRVRFEADPTAYAVELELLDEVERLREILLDNIGWVPPNQSERRFNYSTGLYE